METHAPQPTASPLRVRLDQIVCGVDGGRRATVAVEQAALLARGAHLTFVAVEHLVGSGPNAQAALGAPRAEHALEHAVQIARDHGVAADTRVVHGPDTADELLTAAAAGDLLVLGEPLYGRAGGIIGGATSTRILHRATLPVLIARPPPTTEPFPQRIMLATDGSGCSDRAAELTAALAAAHDSEVILLHAGPYDGEQNRRMRAQADLIAAATGHDPHWIEPVHDEPVAAITACADWRRATLVVLGARGVTGVRALGSVSERVAHEAPCSVLVARG